METLIDSDGTGLVKSFNVQRRVIWALFLREILTRFGRHNIGFLWLFVEPMIFTLGVTALWIATKSVHGSNIPIVAFALTGYSSVLLWRNMPGRCISAIEANLSLMYHRNVKVIDIFLARLLLEGGGASISFVTLAIFFNLSGYLDYPEDIFQVIGGWLMLAWFGCSLAILLGALAQLSEVVDKLWHPASYLLFPLSGAAFLADALPEQARSLILYLPMVHGVEYLREGYFGRYFEAHYSISYMALCCLFLTFGALLLNLYIAKKITPE